jgi:Plasmid pRiA4b ORF-3-like protein
MAGCQTGGMSAEENVPPDTIATLRIDPPIWREVEVPISMTLKQLHAVVEAAIQWEDAYLWEFAVGRERIGSSRGVGKVAGLEQAVVAAGERPLPAAPYPRPQ